VCVCVCVCFAWYGLPSENPWAERGERVLTTPSTPDCTKNSVFCSSEQRSVTRASARRPQRWCSAVGGVASHAASHSKNPTRADGGSVLQRPASSASQHTCSTETRGKATLTVAPGGGHPSLHPVCPTSSHAVATSSTSCMSCTAVTNGEQLSTTPPPFAASTHPASASLPRCAGHLSPEAALSPCKSAGAAARLRLRRCGASMPRGGCDRCRQAPSAVGATGTTPSLLAPAMFRPKKAPLVLVKARGVRRALAGGGHVSARKQTAGVSWPCTASEERGGRHSWPKFPDVIMKARRVREPRRLHARVTGVHSSALWRRPPHERASVGVASLSCGEAEVL
jgi:hypothetical protein